MSEITSIGFVVNPHAGARKSSSWKRDIESALRGTRVQYQVIETQSTEEVQNAVASLRNDLGAVVAVGGDGTVHHVAQAVAGTNCLFGVLPNGSGNDFSRMVGMPKGIEAGVKLMLNASTVRRFDTIEVIVKEELDRRPLRRWSVNTAGVGFDAGAAYLRSRIPVLRGLPLYLSSALVTLATYRPGRYRIVDSAGERTFVGFLVVAGIGQYEGGGFRVLPNAVPDDGLMDVCEVAVSSRRKALPLLIRAIEGSHVGRTGVTSYRDAGIRIAPIQPSPVHADGEVVSTKAREVELKLYRGNLRVVCPI